MPNPSTGSATGLNPARRFYRLRRTRDDQFVEFDFAIGAPELAVELILPRTAFEAFTRQPGMEAISDEEARQTQQRLQDYLYGRTDTHVGAPHDNHQET